MIEMNDSLDQVIQEVATLPKLSQTSLFQKFDSVSDITQSVVAELKNGDKYVVKPQEIEEVIQIIKLNGDSIVKKAVQAYLAGTIIIINNKETSKIPQVLPYIVVSNKEGTRCYIFADRFMTNIKSTQEYRNLMTVLEAAYLSLALHQDPKRFLMNAQLQLPMCDCWWRMIVTPLEAKLYMKGDNLTKASMYAIAFYYKMIHGQVQVGTVPFARFIRDKVEPSVQKQIIDEVNATPDNSIFTLIELIKRINPLRYKDLEQKYIGYFTQACGVSILFAIENMQYLFLLITSALWKSSLSGFSLNKIVQASAKRAQIVLISMNL